MDLQLDLLRASGDSSIRDADGGDDFDDRLFRELASERDHALADIITHEKTDLYCGVSLSSFDKASLALCSGVVNTASHTNNFVGERRVKILDLGILLLESELWITLRAIQWLVTELVSARIVGILCI